MPKQIVVIGAGFAGFWSAFSAKRLVDLEDKAADIEVTVIALEPSLVMRPRLYEAEPASMLMPLESMFKDAGIRFVRGFADKIDTNKQNVKVSSQDGEETLVAYDRLVLAAGSSVVKPVAVTGLEQHAFDIDSLEAASKLETQLKNLENLPDSAARNTVVVCGAGFTGIELVTELPKRMADLPLKPKFILVDSADMLGSTLGSGPRPIIEEAMRGLGIETKLGSRITALDADGLALASGEHIDAKTVMWTAGVRASRLTQQITGPKNDHGRLLVDQQLRVPSCPNVFATADCAAAFTDTKGHYTTMSCQHAPVLGRISGHNAAADLLNLPLKEYSQEEYVTCLDLGAWGTVVTYGWDRDVKLTGDLAKRAKQNINQNVINPPSDAEAALAAARPDASEGNSSEGNSSERRLKPSRL